MRWLIVVGNFGQPVAERFDELSQSLRLGRLGREAL